MPHLTALARSCLTLLMTCGACSEMALADQVWRCSAADGGAVAYQSTPCRGAGKVLPSNPRLTHEERQASAEVAEREAKLARTMGRQRTQREKHEKDTPPAHASLSGPVRQVSVGPRAEARQTPRGQASDHTDQRARQRRRDIFRAEAPARSSKKTQADARAVSPP